MGGNQLIKAGTRPRGTTRWKTLLGRWNSHDVKETGGTPYKLVDLGRKWLGKIAVGTVKVTKYMEVEYFRYVVHLPVYYGQLLPELRALDALNQPFRSWTSRG